MKKRISSGLSAGLSGAVTNLAWVSARNTTRNSRLLGSTIATLSPSFSPAPLQLVWFNFSIGRPEPYSSRRTGRSRTIAGAEEPGSCERSARPRSCLSCGLISAAGKASVSADNLDSISLWRKGCKVTSAPSTLLRSCERLWDSQALATSNAAIFFSVSLAKLSVGSGATAVRNGRTKGDFRFPPDGRMVDFGDCDRLRLGAERQVCWPPGLAMIARFVDGYAL